MFQGITYVVVACFIWGMIFVVPQFMSGFSPCEVALGRYLVYGTISSLLFLTAKWRGKCCYPKRVWLYAFFLSSFSTIGYYIFVVLALRYASPAVCALILGIGPIVIAFYGNRKLGEVSFVSLIFPSILIIAGLLMINIPHLTTAASPSNYLLGLLFSILALTSWCWYVAANAQFLKGHPQVKTSDWTTILGVMTLIWTALFFLFFYFFFSDQLHVEKYFVFDGEMKSFLIGSAILGIFCSWIGAFLWNQASLYLPVSLAGQLTVFETIFGVVFVYMISRTLPSLLEVVGVLTLLVAMIYALRKFSKNIFSSKAVS